MHQNRDPGFGYANPHSRKTFPQEEKRGLEKHNYTDVTVQPVTYKSFESTKKQEEEDFEIEDDAAKLDGLEVEDVAKWQKHHTKLKKN